MAQSVKTESLKQNTADSSECALKQSVKTSERQNETLIGSDLCGSDLSIDNLRGNVLCENALSGNARYENALRKYPAQALVDLNALRNNAARLVETVNSARSESGSGAAVMGVVKADAYGHGLIPAALASLFTSDYKMIMFSVTAMRIALCTFPIIGIQMMSIVFFQAIRKPLSRK